MALSQDTARKASIAFQRFGMGAKPGGMNRIGADPKAALIAELNAPGIAAITDPTLPSYAEACVESVSGRSRSEGLRQLELSARLDKHMAVEVGFVERLVVFWSNHFSMASDKSSSVRGTVGQFERDVIRKHVLGRFSNMLRGAVRHPAMIAFLDNEQSIGPGSPLGYKRRVSYTENLARELLELHTVGTGNYAEADVAALAKMLTGWSYVRPWEADKGQNGGSHQNRGQFIFRSEWHEQGPIKFKGRIYPDEGLKQADRALYFLGRHRATAEHLAFKLVRHFITDQPTAAMVEPIKQVFLQTRGDLKAVALALLDLPEAWSEPLAKLRTPYEFKVAQFRALRTRYTEAEDWALTRILNALHQPVWNCPSPDGYSDETLHWLTPDAISVRVDAAQLAARTFSKRVTIDPRKLANSLYGRALSAATRERIAGAGAQPAALTILFSSPEFQRR